MKIYLNFSTLFLTVLFFSSCELTSTKEPEEYELLDGPTEGLSQAESSRFVLGDERIAITPAISFRPTPGTVFRINYRYQWDTDVINNPAEEAVTWYFGFSTYF